MSAQWIVVDVFENTMYAVYVFYLATVGWPASLRFTTHISTQHTMRASVQVRSAVSSLDRPVNLLDGGSA